MANGIRLIVCDLDGTLLNDEKAMTKYSIETLRQVRRRGIKLCFASGRHLQMMRLYSELADGVDYTISCNGAVACSQEKKQALFRSCLKPAVVKELLHFLFSENLGFLLHSDTRIYCAAGRESLLSGIRSYETLARIHQFPQSIDSDPITPETKLPENVLKIVVYEQDEAKLRQLTSRISACSATRTESTGYGLTGIFSNGVSKRTALEKVMADCGAEKEHVVVFGDYENDLSMFSCAAHRVAMENATASLKERATHIAGDHNADGVARYIQQFIL